MINVVLQLKNDNANVKEIELSKQSTIIGRGADCGLRIASSDVSRKHCRIDIDEKKATVTDLGSSNGTYLNQQKLAPNVSKPLLNSSILKIGPMEVTISIRTQKAAAVTEEMKITKPSAPEAEARVKTKIPLTDETVAVDPVSAKRAAKKKNVDDTVPMAGNMQDLYAEALAFEEMQEKPEKKPKIKSPPKNVEPPEETIKLDVINDELVKDSAPDLDIVIETEGSDIIIFEDSGASIDAENADQEIADFLKNLKDE